MTITNEHLAARLELLAHWRAFETGNGPKPHDHYPIGEAHYLRIAAQRIREMSCDLMVVSARDRAKLVAERPYLQSPASIEE